MYKKTLTTLFMLLLVSAADARSLSDSYNERPAHRNRNRIARNNTLTVAMGVGAVDALGFAGGGEYERFILPNGLLSATITAMGISSGTVSVGEFGYGETRTHYSGFFAAPGLRFHPVGNDRKADLGLGLSIPLGISNRRDQYHQSYTSLIEMNDRKLFAAVLAQVGVNLKSAGGFVFGAYLSFGPIISEGRRSIPQAEESSNIYLQFGLRMGGCW